MALKLLLKRMSRLKFELSEYSVSNTTHGSHDLLMHSTIRQSISQSISPPMKHSVVNPVGSVRNELLNEFECATSTGTIQWCE